MTYPADANLKHGIRRLLYSLKRQYGHSVDLHKLLDSTIDVRTGQKQQTVQVTRITRAVVLPGHLVRKVIRGISLISANKMVVTGGTYDRCDRIFIVECRDALGVAGLTADDWIVFAGRKYQIAEVDEFEFETAWFVVARELKGESIAQTSTLQVGEELQLDEYSQATVEA